MRLGNRHLAAKILAMQEASNRSITPVPSIQGISATLKLSNLNITTSSTPTPTAVVETNVSKLNVDVYHDNGLTSASDCTKTNGKKLAEAGDLITPQADSLLITDSGNEIPFPSTSGHFKNSKIIEGDRNIDDEPQARDSADRKEENIGNLSPAKNNENKVKDKDRNKNKSGHARTHAIIINLDDKSRCSEEVTV